MTFVVLIVLALIWAAVLIPPMIRNRVEGNAADSIGDFRQRLSVLRRATPAVVEPAYRLQTSAKHTTAAPVLSGDQKARRLEAQRRRRDVLVSLGGAVIASLVLGAMFGMRSFLLLNLLFDALLAGYLYLLVRMRNAEAERAMKLRYLPKPAAVQHAPAPTAEVPAHSAVN